MENRQDCAKKSEIIIFTKFLHIFYEEEDSFHELWILVKYPPPGDKGIVSTSNKPDLHLFDVDNQDSDCGYLSVANSDAVILADDIGLDDAFESAFCMNQTLSQASVATELQQSSWGVRKFCHAACNYDSCNW